MSTVLDSVQLTLTQKLVPTISESLWNIDPVYSMMRRSWHRVVRDQVLGRGWQVLKTWNTGLAGGALFASAGGSNILSGPKQYTAYDTPSTYPAYDETTAAGFVQTSTGLVEHRGNFYLPHEIMRSDKMSASIGSVVALNLKGIADLLSLQESAVWFSTDTTNYALADIGDTSANVSNVSGDTAAMKFVLGTGFDGSGGTNASGRIHRFRPGLKVDLYSSDGATKRNLGFYLTVDDVDPIEETIVIRRDDGQTFQTTTTLNGGVTYATAGGDDDIIVLKDSLAVAPNSLESWIADGSTVTSFFGLAVGTYSQFKSFRAAIGAVLTESVLNKRIGQFFEAFPGRTIDCGLTTMGVLLNFIDNLSQGPASPADGTMRYDRNGEPLRVEAGWESFKYRFGSRPIEFYTSTQSAKGTLYLGKFKNGGITRYVPPPLPGAKTDSRFGSEVEFLGALGGAGYQGIFKHAHSANGATTNFYEAPFTRYWNLMPSQPNWMALSTITEIW